MVHFLYVCCISLANVQYVQLVQVYSLKSKNPDFLYHPSNLHLLQVHINMNMRSTTVITGLNQVVSFLGNNFALVTRRRPT